MNTQEKYKNLKKYLLSLESVAVAFFSGVDSTLLLKVASNTLKNRVIAITVKLQSFPKRELDQTIKFCKEENIKHIVYNLRELNIKGFSKNSKNRYYICKKNIYKNTKVYKNKQY